MKTHNNIIAVLIAIIISFSSIISTAQVIKNDVQINEASENYDYLIVTNRYLKHAVESLKEWREQQGYSVKIVTGFKNPEKLREFLQDNYLDWGLKYVLIIGSHKSIPMKYCWPNSDDHRLLKPFQTWAQPVPTDYYYAELTCDWDKDNDRYFCEFQDDINNFTDFQPELYVGRIPFDSIIRVKKFCQKIIDYEKDNGEWKKKSLLLGFMQEYENHTGGGEYGRVDNAEEMELLKNNIFIPNDFICTTMYEKGGISPSNHSCDYPLSHENVVNQWKTGYGFVNWVGHSGTVKAYSLIWNKDNGNGIPEVEEVEQNVCVKSVDSFKLNDDKPSVVYALSCFNIPPEPLWAMLEIIYFKIVTYPISIGMSLLRNGAVVYIGSARPTLGGWPINYNFFENVAVYNDNYGDAFYKAKCDYLKVVEEGNWEEIMGEYCTIWNSINMGFYGDPATKMRSNICNLEEIK